MQEFSNLGDLLRAWREYSGVTQEVFAEKLGVNVKEVGRWERNERPPTPFNLSLIAEKTHIPFIVLHHLNGDASINYNLTKRTFAYTDLDENLNHATELSQQHLEKISHLGTVSKIETDHDAQLISDYDLNIYPTQNPLAKDMYVAASAVLTDLNVILRDRRGFHCGHFFCIPLTQEAYMKLKIGELHEGELHLPDLARLDTKAVNYFYVCSVYAAHACIGGYIFSHVRKWLQKQLQVVGLNGNSVIGAYAVTDDGCFYCHKLNFREIRTDQAEFKKLRTLAPPTFFETTLTKLLTNHSRRRN